MLELSLLSQKIQQYEQEVIELRRQFHRIPELGFEETKTTAFLCRVLEEKGIEYRALKPTGAVAYIGPKDGFTIALRADIDGLPVQEETGLPFASEHSDRMHACGHDGHMAGLLGTAFILKEMEEHLAVRVKLIFQPSEENTLGAAAIIKQGVLDDVDAVFGLHLFSDMELGQFSVEAGPRMAQTDRFSITFHGKGGHAGKPHQCVDATVMAADFLMGIQTIVAREVDPTQPAVVTVGSFHSGSQYNVISGQAVVEGTCRTFDEKVAAHLRDSIKRRASHVAEAYGGSEETTYHFGSHPPVVNDGPFSEAVLLQATELLGREQTKVAPMMLGEDFSWYQQQVPGVFAFLGCRSPEQKECYPNHHPCFTVDERALADAMALHLSAVLAAEEQIQP